MREQCIQGATNTYRRAVGHSGDGYDVSDGGEILQNIVKNENEERVILFPCLFGFSFQADDGKTSVFFRFVVNTEKQINYYNYFWVFSFAG